MSGRVILVNGPSSVGKTSIAVAFQAAAPEPWLRLGIDSFLDFVPERLISLQASADSGFRWHPAGDDADHPTRITVGQYGHEVVRGMHRAIAALAESGLDVIVDDVLLEPRWLDDYLVALEGLEVLFVGVIAPLAIIEQRELARSDRFPRQARGHYDVVHQHDLYDVRIDTSTATADDGARAIAERLAAGPGTAFDELRARGHGGIRA